MFKKSLQRRVFYIFGGFTLLLSLLYAAISLTVAYYVEDQVLENFLAQKVQYLRTVFNETGEIPSPRGDYIQVYSAPEKAPEEIARAVTSGATEIFSKTGKHYHAQPLYLDQRHSALVVAEVTNLLAVRNMPGDIFSLFALALVLTVLLALGLAYKISRRTTKPILALAQAVLKRQDKVNEATAIPLEAEDEIDFLDKSIHSTLEQLNRLLERESEFNRDLSHELRTPLTIILNILSLAENRAPTEAEVQQLRTAAYDIKKSVNALLALARADSTSNQLFSLRQTVEECILAMHPKLEARNFEIHLSMDDLEVVGNPQMAALVINNLLENALAHAAEKRLEIRFNGTSLCFSNATEITLSGDPTHPSVKHPGSEGFGQGLFLVRRILETLNWSYKVSSPSNSIFRVCINPRQP